MISTLTILELMILELVVSTLTIAWALGPGACAPKPGAICAPPGAPHLNGGDGGLWPDYSRQHCARSPPVPPAGPSMVSGGPGAMGGIAPRIPPYKLTVLNL